MSRPRKLPPGIREHRGRYQVRFHGPDGVRRAQSFERLTDAKAFKSAADTDKARGVFIDPRGATVSFDDWARQHLAGRSDLRDSTRATDDSYARCHLLPHFGSTPLGRIDPLDVQEWVVALSTSGLSPKTVRECYRLLGSIMRAAVDARLIPQSPCQGIKRPRVARPEQRFLTPGEIEKLAAAIDPHYRTLVYAAVYLGCRWGELAGLKRTNLDLLRRRLQVVGSLEEVGGRIRWLPETKSSASRRALSVPEFLVEMIAAHLAGAPSSEFVFPSKRGRPLRRSSFRAGYWLPAVHDADLAPLRFHDLRHTCAALLIAEGAHPKEIQARLGHSSITTTLNVYGHLFPELDARLAERLDGAYRAGLSGPNGDQMGTNGDSTVVELETKKNEKTL